MPNQRDAFGLHRQGALRDYLAAARENFNSAPDVDSDLCAIEFVLLEDVERMLSAALQSVALRGDLTGFLLGVSGYNLHLGAVRNALTGQPWTVYPLLRASLEALCYWARIEAVPGLAKTWLERHKDASARGQSRKAFTSAVTAVAAELGSEPDSLGTLLIDMYDSLIDFGAHPNPRALLETVTFSEDEGRHVVNVSALESIDSPASRRSMIACAECGAILTALLKCPPIAKRPLGEPDLSDVVSIFRRTSAYLDSQNSERSSA